MKKYSMLLLVLSLLFLAMPVYAQHKTAIHRPLELRKPQPTVPPSAPMPESSKWNSWNAPSTVIDREVRHDIMLAPMFKFSQVNHTFGFLAGGRLGWIINHRYLLGLEGYWLVNDVPGPRTDAGQRPDLAMKYGGLTLEYILRPQDAVHFSVSTLTAIGSVVYDYDVTRNDDTYWAVEPALNVYLNMTEYLRLGLGVGYRWVSDVDLEDLDEGQDLSGVAATLSLNFGTYGETLVP